MHWQCDMFQDKQQVALRRHCLSQPVLSKETALLWTAKPFTPKPPRFRGCTSKEPGGKKLFHASLCCMNSSTKPFQTDKGGPFCSSILFTCSTTPFGIGSMAGSAGLILQCDNDDPMLASCVPSKKCFSITRPQNMPYVQPP